MSSWELSCVEHRHLSTGTSYLFITAATIGRRTEDREKKRKISLTLKSLLEMINSTKLTIWISAIPKLTFKNLLMIYVSKPEDNSVKEVSIQYSTV